MLAASPNAALRLTLLNAGRRAGLLSSTWRQRCTACPRLGSHHTRRTHASHSRPSQSACTSTAVGSLTQSATAAHVLASLQETQQKQLRDYLDFLLEVNKSMNLTAVRDPTEAWERHVMDSLALIPIIEATLPLNLAAGPPLPHSPASATASTNDTTTSSSSSSSSSGSEHTPESAADRQGTPSTSGRLSIIDVGTGPGLPGMVLAIARPQWQVTLLDSLQKRCKFMDNAAEHAGVRNIKTVWCRAEDGGRRADLREAHDVAVARAVADMRVLCELCLPFVRPGGTFIAAKGPAPDAEVAGAGKAAGLLGGGPLQLRLVDSFSPEGQRTAVVVPKIKPTPKKYPRKPGVPNKTPL